MKNYLPVVTFKGTFDDLKGLKEMLNGPNDTNLDQHISLQNFGNLFAKENSVDIPNDLVDDGNTTI